MSVHRRSVSVGPYLKKKAPPPPHTRKCQQKSAQNVYCVVLGQAESGKSTTLNHLFGGREVSPVERETGTEEVLEFGTTFPSGDLRWIDTPGLGDINGLEWDAQIISTIEKFRATHEELKAKIPNVVLLVARFDDNRIQGPMSSFVKMIKSIDYQRENFLDKSRNNLILLLTHVMNGKKSARQEPETRLDLVRNLIKTYTHFPHQPVIVLGENEAEDFELEESGPGSHRLPNGESYPQNLINAILQICVESGDSHGERIFVEAFSERGSLQLGLVRSLRILKPEESQDIIPFLSNLYVNSRSTNLFDRLNTEWLALNRSCTDPGFQRLLTLLERDGFKDYPKLPTDRGTIVEILAKLVPYDPCLAFLAESVLGFTQPPISRRSVGCSFDFGQERLLDKSPIEPDHYQSSALLQKLPIGVSYDRAHELRKEAVFFQIFHNRADYSKQRRQDLGIPESDSGLVTEGRIQAAGYNVLRPHDYSDPKSKHRARVKTRPETTLKSIKIVKEFRTGRLQYGAPETGPHISLDFSLAIQRLNSRPFNRRNRNSRQEWREFFSAYGTHVVSSAYVGGAIEVTLNADQVKNLFNLNLIDPSNSELLKRELIKLLFDFEHASELPTGLILNVDLIGGNKGQSHDQKHMYELPLEARRKYVEDWKASLILEPEVLRMSLSLIEIKEFIARVIGVEVDRVMRPHDIPLFKNQVAEVRGNQLLQSYSAAKQMLLCGVPNAPEKRGHNKCKIV